MIKMIVPEIVKIEKAVSEIRIEELKAIKDKLFYEIQKIKDIIDFKENMQKHNDQIKKL